MNNKKKTQLEDNITLAIEEFSCETLRALSHRRNIPEAIASEIMESDRFDKWLTDVYRVCVGPQGDLLEDFTEAVFHKLVWHHLTEDSSEEYLKLFRERLKECGGR